MVENPILLIARLAKVQAHPLDLECGCGGDVWEPLSLE